MTIIHYMPFVLIHRTPVARSAMWSLIRVVIVYVKRASR